VFAAVSEVGGRDLARHTTYSRGRHVEAGVAKIDGAHGVFSSSMEYCILYESGELSAHRSIVTENSPFVKLGA